MDRQAEQTEDRRRHETRSLRTWVVVHVDADALTEARDIPEAPDVPAGTSGTAASGSAPCDGVVHVDADALTEARHIPEAPDVPAGTSGTPTGAASIGPRPTVDDSGVRRPLVGPGATLSMTLLRRLELPNHPPPPPGVLPPSHADW